MKRVQRAWRPLACRAFAATLANTTAAADAGSSSSAPQPTAGAPPGYSTTRTGDVRDFEYFVGAGPRRSDG